MGKLKTNDMLIRKQVKSSSKDLNRDPEEDEEDDTVVCGICLDGNVYDNNEILFCDKCNIPVHQTCYGVDTIPEGSWFCKVCEANENPQDLQCQLCDNKGGAYKRTVDGKWAHGLCATWIPEVYGTGENGQILNLNLLDQKRMKLKCQICQSKNGGCCIQCTYGKCAKSAHPWCVFHRVDAGYASRIIRDDKDDTVWEIFCKTHASSVKDPIKPKSKAKSIPIFLPENIEEDISDIPEKKKKTNKAYSKKTAIELHDDESSTNSFVNDTVSNIPFSNVINKSLENFPLKESEDYFTEEPQENFVISTHSKSKNRGFFPVYTISEWPGQAEGEGLDLDHFWNVISMSFPEDHNTQWIEYMTSPLRFNLLADCHDNLSNLPTYQKLNEYDEEQLMQIIEEKSCAFGNEREKLAIFDYDKRDNFVNSTFDIINSLTPHIYENELPSTYLLNSSKSSRVDGDYSVYREEENLFLIENVIENLDVTCQKDVSKKINIVYNNSCDRYSAIYNIELIEKENDISNKTESSFDLGANSNEDITKIMKNQIITSSIVMPAVELSNYVCSLNLSTYDKMDDMSPVRMIDKTLICKNHDNEINEVIKSYQFMLRYLQSSVYTIANSILNSSDFTQSVGSYMRQRHVSSEIESLYVKQRVWSKICSSIKRGMKDQNIDFNKHVTESIPASWKINRNAKVADDDNDFSDDAICMVCFDGLSEENNRIIYCDGCNTSVHQACYGISEIPDGDYFCDRCEGIKQVFMDDYQFDPVTMITCCLCPIQHGGLKQTADSRWVHLNCAIWSGASITDLNEMSPVDISCVKVADNIKSSLSCVICKSSIGYIITCVGNENSICDRSFHPLCAWFEGFSLTTELTDPTCRGLERNGLFPSGLKFSFQCLLHNSNDRVKQKHLRLKYRLKIDDLEGIPGQKLNKRKHKRKSNSTRQISLGNIRSNNVTSSIVNKDLSKDLYDNSICGICLSSIGFESKFMNKEIFNNIVSIKNKVNDILLDDYNDIVKNSKFIENLICKHCKPNDFPEKLCQISDRNEAVHDSQDELMNIYHKGKVEEISNVIVDNFIFNDRYSGSQHKDSFAVDSVTCVTCKVTIHAKCLHSIGGINTANISSYKCDPCTLGLTDCRCELCPRRGGYFKPTTIKKWCHVFCARNTNGNIKVLSNNPRILHLSAVSIENTNENSSTNVDTNNVNLKVIDEVVSNFSGVVEGSQRLNGNTVYNTNTVSNNDNIPLTLQNPLLSNLLNLSNGVIDIRNLPKENRKHKCYLCNRRVGQPNSCNYPDCTNFFHAICLIRSINGYLRKRNGIIECYCCDHKPEGVEVIYLHSIDSLTKQSDLQSDVQLGCWIDTYEINRLRNILDSTRTIFDSINRREKLKKLVNKVDNEYFSHSLIKQIDRIKGRKTNNLLSNSEINEIFEYSDDEIYSSDDDTVIKINSQPIEKVDGRRKSNKLIAVSNEWIVGLLDSSNGIDISISTRSGEKHVSGLFTTSDGDISLSNLFIQVSGFEYNKHEIFLDHTFKPYYKKVKERIDKQKNATREICNVFKSLKESNDFYNNLTSYLSEKLSSTLDQFKESIKPLVYEYPKVIRKRGYAVVDGVDMNLELSLKLDLGKYEFKEEILFSSRRRKHHESQDFIETPLKKKTKSQNKDTKSDKNSKSLNLVEERDSGGYVGVIEILSRKSSRLNKFSFEVGDNNFEKNIGKSSNEEDTILSEISSNNMNKHVQKRKISELEITHMKDENQSIIKSNKRVKTKEHFENQMDKSVSEKKSVITLETKKYNRKSFSNQEYDRGVDDKDNRAVHDNNNEIDDVSKIIESKSNRKTDRKLIKSNVYLQSTDELPLTEKAFLVTSPLVHRSKLENRLKITNTFSKTATLQSKGIIFKENSIGGLQSNVICNCLKIKYPLDPTSDLMDFDHVFDKMNDTRVKLINNNADCNKVVNTNVENNFGKEKEDFPPYNLSSNNISNHDSENYCDIATNLTIANDWYVYSYKKLYVLERRLQDILHYIEACDINDKLLSDISTRDFTKSTFSNKKNNKYLISKNFLSIPSTNISTYKLYVKRIITIDVLKGLLRDHFFQSFNCFQKLFYEMINNARVVTNHNSEVWKDSEYLSLIFEKLKEITMYQSVELPIHSLRIISKLLSDDLTVDENMTMTCYHCDNKFVLNNWPNKWNLTDSSYRYMCPSCVNSNSTALIGMSVRVWWNNDKTYYDGVVNAYDEYSKKHRILYEDAEWEFIDIKEEPIVICNNSNDNIVKIDST